MSYLFYLEEATRVHIAERRCEAERARLQAQVPPGCGGRVTALASLWRLAASK